MKALPRQSFCSEFGRQIPARLNPSVNASAEALTPGNFIRLAHRALRIGFFFRHRSGFSLRLSFSVLPRPIRASRQLSPGLLRLLPAAAQKIVLRSESEFDLQALCIFLCLDEKGVLNFSRRLRSPPGRRTQRTFWQFSKLPPRANDECIRFLCAKEVPVSLREHLLEHFRR